jgi:hypothetical protein
VNYEYLFTTRLGCYSQPEYLTLIKEVKMAPTTEKPDMGYGFLDQMGIPFVELDGKNATIKFKLQDGPIKEVGENGCQVDMMVYLATVIIREFNHRFPCRENSIAITKLEEASMWLKKRKAEREVRGVEGFNKE